jgi:hypothetical protein
MLAKEFFFRAATLGLFFTNCMPAALAADSASPPATPLGIRPDLVAPPAGLTTRYVIPYTYSVTPAAPASRSVTFVTVYNASSQTCNVAVEFQFGSVQTRTCLVTLSIPAGTTQEFCSRPVADPLYPCHAACSPALTFNMGPAFVSSGAGTCNTIDVDARIVQTSDTADHVVQSSSRLTVDKIGTATNGD